MGAPSGGWPHCAAAATFAQAGGWEQQCAAAGTYQAGGWEASVPGASYAPAVEYLPQGQVEVGGVVFLCDPRTENECLQRRLLGMPGARSSPAYGIVAETLRQLGHPAADPGADPVEREPPLHAPAEARGDGRGDGAR